MPEAERDADPVKPPEPIEPVAAAADDTADKATLLATIEAYKTEIVALRAERAERDARDAAVWLPLKSAAIDIGMKYRKARDWAAAAIREGRTHEACKHGRVIVNVTALRAFHELKPPPR